MFDTVGRYRDPEATLRRALAGCLTAALAFSAISGTILLWIAIWLWPYFLELCRWIVALILRLLLGQQAADAWLAEAIVVPEPVEIAAIDVEIGEPYVEDDPPLAPAPLPGELLPPAPEPLDTLAIAPLRGWNDDADFAEPRAEMLAAELAAMDMAVLGALSSGDEGGVIAVLGSGSVDEGDFADLLGSAEGYGGLGLSGSGVGGGGRAEGFGGLGTIGHGDGGSGSGYGGGGGLSIGSSRDRKRDRDEPEEVELAELVAGYDGVEGGLVGVEGGIAGGVIGGVEGGVVGGVIGGVAPSFSDPVLVDRGEPDYPVELRDQGVEGQCNAKVRVGTDGRGKLVSLSGCPNAFRGPVSDAVARSRWLPAERDGVPVEETVTVRYAFVIE